MKHTVIKTVTDRMRSMLTVQELETLTMVMDCVLSKFRLVPMESEGERREKMNTEVVESFISTKRVEGCSEKTLTYYRRSVSDLLNFTGKNVLETDTNDIRRFLSDMQERGLSKVSMDNFRRNFSSFFGWLENEDLITKSPVRRVHKVRPDVKVKRTVTDEEMQRIREACTCVRNLAIIDLLASSGIRVSELVSLNRDDISLNERTGKVFGKGSKEREIYFNANAKVHIQQYLSERTDDNPALFVTLARPFTRITAGSVETWVRAMGKELGIEHLHPHKFRRTLATNAIDKGMPIEQVQTLLGHKQIESTMHYAMVKQSNVRISHKKYIS